MRVDDEVDRAGIAVDRFEPRAHLLTGLKADLNYAQGSIKGAARSRTMASSIRGESLHFSRTARISRRDAIAAAEGGGNPRSPGGGRAWLATAGGAERQSAGGNALCWPRHS